MTQFFKGDIEYAKKDFRQAISCYTEGIELKCNADKLNAELYFRRALSHRHLGELTRSFIFCLTLVT